MSKIISFPGLRYPHIAGKGLSRRQIAKVELLVDWAAALAERDPVYRRRLKEAATRIQKQERK